MKTPLILMVDDDPAMRRMIAEFLGSHGMEVACVANGREMRRTLAQAVPDLVLLDLRLGGEDGLDLLRELRHDQVMPVIVITAHRLDEVDHVIGLEMGADDYVTKPFGLRELLARIRAALRRRRMDSLRPERDVDKRYAFDRWIFDQVRRELHREGADAVPLTKSEFALLSTFVAAPRRPLTREHLLQATRMHDDVFDRSIDVQILRLRRKIEEDPRAPRLIRTERGLGYVFDAEVTEL